MGRGGMRESTAYKRAEQSGELTFYFSSGSRDLGQTQVGGGHDVIVGKAVPRAGDREGLKRGRLRTQPTQQEMALAVHGEGSQASHWIVHWRLVIPGRKELGMKCCPSLLK